MRDIQEQKHTICLLHQLSICWSLWLHKKAVCVSMEDTNLFPCQLWNLGKIHWKTMGRFNGFVVFCVESSKKQFVFFGRHIPVDGLHPESKRTKIIRYRHILRGGYMDIGQQRHKWLNQRSRKWLAYGLPRRCPPCLLKLFFGGEKAGVLIAFTMFAYSDFTGHPSTMILQHAKTTTRDFSWFFQVLPCLFHSVLQFVIFCQLFVCF